MKLIAKIKLIQTEDQESILHETLHRTNEACNYISSIAWDSELFKKYALQQACYYEVRETFDLSAQMTIRALGKVADAYKTSQTLLKDRNRKIKAQNKMRVKDGKDPKLLKELRQCVFGKNGGFPYDSRILSYKLAEQTVSIWTLAGRITVPFQAGQGQLDLLEFQRGESDLAFIRGSFYLFSTCDIEEPAKDDVTDFLGVDLGIVNIATTSDGDIHKGSHVNQVRHRNRKLRQKLQKKGTKSAKRLLKKRSGRESRFVNDVNHCISKQLVKQAKDTQRGIALEDLKGIRELARLRKSQRTQLHSWSFDDLQNKILYKSELYGVPVVLVDPAYTSQACPECGTIDKKNRKSQAKFECCACGFSAHADTVGAVNISHRAVAVNPPDADSA